MTDLNSQTPNAFGLTPDALEKDKALRLFQYLTKLAELNSKPVVDIDNYDGVIWLNKFDGIDKATLSTEPSSEVWASIEKVKLPEPPPLPAVCKPWVETSTLKDPKGQEPTIREQIEVLEKFNDPQDGPVNIPVTKMLTEQEDVLNAWGEFLPLWRDWSAQTMELLPARDLYNSLFSLLEKQKNFSEQYETVLSVGFLETNGVRGKIRRHLFSIKARVQREAESGTMLIKPDLSSRFSLEEEMLEASEAPERSVIDPFVHIVEELGADAYLSQELHSALRVWAHNANMEGDYSDNFKLEPSSSSLKVTFSPALILRKRTQRSTLRMYRQISESLQTVEKVPDNVVDLLEPRSTQLNLDIKEEKPIYFPLPSNDKQRAIVKRLRNNRGVVVQGPPGTGKSHTIANLISHLLAEGQRVLVTSQTDRALEVLRDKLPSDIAELCVGVVGQGKDGANDLEKSLNALDHEYSEEDWRENREAKIKKLNDELKNLLEQKDKLNKSLREARLSQIQPYTIASYFGSASAIASELSVGQEQYSWYTDVNNSEGPNNNDALELLALLRYHTDSQREQENQEFPQDPVSFETFIRALNELNYLKERPAPSFRYRVIASEANQRVEIVKLLKDFSKLLSLKSGGVTSWRNSLSSQAIEGRVRELDFLKDITLSALKALEHAQWLDSIQLNQLPPERRQLLIAQGKALAAHFAQGGKIKNMGMFTSAAKANREFLENVIVNGSNVSTAQACEAAFRVLEAEEALSYAQNQWQGRLELFGTFSHRRIQLEEILEELEKIRSFGALANQLNGRLSEVFGEQTFNWTDTSLPSSLISTLEYENVKERIIELNELFATTWQDAWLEPFKSHHPALVCQKGLDALKDEDPQKYKEALEEIETLKTLKETLTAERTMLSKLEMVSPTLTKELLQDPNNEKWDVRLRHVKQAHAWRQAEEWHNGFLKAWDAGKLSEELKNIEQRILKTTQGLCREKAWLAALSRMTPEQFQHLRGYQKALQRLGKGTGKHAGASRREAQEHVEAAQGAVPAWIMPIYRIAETIRPDKHAFDVVIVDEASQSGVEALFLMWMAKQIVVVGDDKQVTPDNVGLNTDDAMVYRNQYLHDIPLMDNFSPDSSFFDQATVRYEGRIMLTEHFRCMPEIIDFSNRLMYNGQLQPLKQFRQDRLPPLKHTYVPDGVVTGGSSNKINKPEAQAIVDTIVDCINDPAYEGKTMGVISLLGPHQAAYIENLLIEKVGADEILERKIRCSDAPGFQGDEREVIFLSLVTAPTDNGRRPPALTAQKYYRRFNVAASRAEEQMWLFHSVQSSDLNPECVRSKILQHLAVPRETSIAGFEGEVTRNERHEQFDSLFEQRVYLDIVERGYLVQPQWETLGRRIDLVVLGNESKLAVECDGDFWHGPDRYSEDLARERDLQRVGWEFFRIRESEYNRDKKAALEKLWPLLEKRGIRPAGFVAPKINPPVKEALRGHPELHVSTPVAAGEKPLPVTVLPEQEIQPFLATSPAHTPSPQRSGTLEAEVIEQRATPLIKVATIPAETQAYIDRLNNKVKKKYALDYALYSIGLAPMPPAPCDEQWVGRVERQVKRYNEGAFKL